MDIPSSDGRLSVWTNPQHDATDGRTEGRADDRRHTIIRQTFVGRIKKVEFWVSKYFTSTDELNWINKTDRADGLFMCQGVYVLFIDMAYTWVFCHNHSAKMGSLMKINNSRVWASSMFDWRQSGVVDASDLATSLLPMCQAAISRMACSPRGHVVWRH